ncbi:hypothetical protein [Chroococcus sp. FPU101]|uniref:hypothetical protein n=1 Tax=Chroococcus sp. FPU101 TaxID=1974212 RepID=UPI001A907572|nr:hypothetical protein [Chroococcus sp. FPU101]GFE72281.1 hypothetical protein CFPU101_48910 [Chroococcus sp. FPU101]
MLNKYQKGGRHTQLSFLAIALMVILLPACANNSQRAEVSETTPADKESVTPAKVSNKTEDLIGELVTVRSQPINKISDNVFTITDQKVFGGERIVVVNNSGVPVNLPIPQDAKLQVTGTVDKFDVNALKQKYKADLGEPSSYQEYAGMPVIVARSVALAPIPGEIGENPQPYYNKVIAVPAEVKQIYGSAGAFVLEDNTILGNEPLLVLVTNQLKDQVPIKQGDKIVATGTLRPFVAADIEREYNYVWDAQLRQQLETDYAQKPVLIVEGIYLSALPLNAD